MKIVHDGVTYNTQTGDLIHQTEIDGAKVSLRTIRDGHWFYLFVEQEGNDYIIPKVNGDAIMQAKDEAPEKWLDLLRSEMAKPHLEDADLR